MPAPAQPGLTLAARVAATIAPAELAPAELRRHSVRPTLPAQAAAVDRGWVQMVQLAAPAAGTLKPSQPRALQDLTQLAPRLAPRLPPQERVPQEQEVAVAVGILSTLHRDPRVTRRETFRSAASDAPPACCSTCHSSPPPPPPPRPPLPVACPVGIARAVPSFLRRPEGSRAFATPSARTPPPSSARH
eukprot:scaffold65618_cov60-Phaeocystis_antarctica.AAC.6